MKKRLIAVGVLAGLFGATGAVAQQDKGTSKFLSRSYVGVSAGSANVDDVAALSNVGAGAVTLNTDDSDRFWKIYGGYRFSDWVALELAWNDFGDYSFRGTLLGTPVSAKTSLDGFSFSAVGNYPLNDQFDVFGKLGALFWDSRGTSNVVDPDDDGIDPLVGIGARYTFNQKVAVRGEWEWFNDVGGSDLSALSLGVSVNF